MSKKEAVTQHCSICDFNEERKEPVYPTEDPDCPFACADCLNLITALDALDAQRTALAMLAEDFEARGMN